MPDENQAWRRRKTETIAAFAAFQLYLEHGSIDAAWRATKQGQTSHAKRAPGQWAKWSVKHEWVARAAAYADMLAEQDRVAYETERRQDKIDRVRLLKGYRGKLTQALTRLAPETADWQAVTSGLRMVMNELRSEYDDQPKAKLDVEHSGEIGTRIIEGPNPNVR